MRLSFVCFLSSLLWVSSAWAAIQFQPATPTTSDEVFAITSASGGYTNVQVVWSGPKNGSSGCAPGRPCGERKNGQFFWHHRLGKLPAGTYQVVFKSDQCQSCDTATLTISPPCQPKAETCDNKDNDCDGLTDEGLERECYSGPANTKGKRPCKAGKQICIAGKWATCTGEVTPQQELCNDKIDNDCDGQLDESCECKGAETRPCYRGPKGTEGVGLCKAGTQRCQSGVWSECQGEVMPAAKDLCGDGVDNNCDGKVDEGCGDCQDGAIQDCYTGPAQTAGVGACQKGQQQCLSGKWAACKGEVTPATEICGDQLDSDCDGKLDNGCGSQESVGDGPAPERTILEQPTPFDAGAPPPLSCDNGTLIDSCDTRGNCKKICRVSRRGCACHSNGLPLSSWGLFLLCCVLGVGIRRRTRSGRCG